MNERVTVQAEAKRPGLFYGYAIVAVTFLLNLIMGGTLYTFSVFFKPLAGDFGWTRAATSGAFSLYMILHGFLYIFTGRLSDRLGTRIIISCSGFLMGVGYMLMSQISAIWQLYLFYGVIIAIGMSGGYVPLVSAVTRWFTGNRKRGLMVGIAVAGVGAGTMVMPPVANWLISEYSWKTAYVVIGIVVMISIMSAAQLLKRAPGQTQQMPHNRNGVQEEIPGHEARGLSLHEALRTRQFWLLAAAYFSFGVFLQAIMVHIVMHAIDLGISETVAANIFIAVGGLSVIGRIFLGSVADRIGNRKVIIASFMLLTVAFAWLLIAREAWMIFIFAAAFGFAYGGLVSAQSPLVADLFGVSSHGAILGVIVFIITAGSAVGPVMSGGIYDITGSYTIAFLVCGAFSLAGIILTLLLRPIAEGGE
ncbi:MFS transporter [Chloroflexota bacterium]